MILRVSMAVNAAGAVLRTLWAKLRGYRILASELDYRQRIHTCRACEHFDPDSEQCRICGCFAEAKTRLAVEQCPKGKWRAIFSR